MEKILEKLVGRRFTDLDHVSEGIVNLGLEEPCLEDNRSESNSADHSILGATFWENGNGVWELIDFELYYLKDNQDNYYITEVTKLS